MAFQLLDWFQSINRTLLIQHCIKMKLTKTKSFIKLSDVFFVNFFSFSRWNSGKLAESKAVGETIGGLLTTPTDPHRHQ